MKRNPRHDYFLKRLEEGRQDWLTPWTGDCWRFQSIEFPEPVQILSGAGAYKNGGRWNSPGSFRTLYGSTDDETAVRESAAMAKYFGFPFREPRLFVAIHVRLGGILDLTQAKLRRKMGITLKEIREEDWRKSQSSNAESLSQSLGRAAFEVGAEGIAVPSFARRGGINLAVFPENLAISSEIALWNQKDLEQFLKRNQ